MNAQRILELMPVENRILVQNALAILARYEFTKYLIQDHVLRCVESVRLSMPNASELVQKAALTETILIELEQVIQDLKPRPEEGLEQ